MSSAIGTYHALYFEDIASAVDFCQALVPHIVPGPMRSTRDEDRAVVWFHVPRRSRCSTRDGCYLFLSAGALAAAGRAGLHAPLSGYIAGRALPGGCVLLFGEDLPERPPRSRADGRRASRRRSETYTQLCIPTRSSRENGEAGAERGVSSHVPSNGRRAFSG
jgi:hypothetical protein